MFTILYPHILVSKKSITEVWECVLFNFELLVIKKDEKKHARIVVACVYFSQLFKGE